MDVAVLRGRIASTLDPDADTRRRAELDLKSVSIPSKFYFLLPLTDIEQAEEHPGFTDALLDILQAEQNPAVRLSSMQTPSQYIPRCRQMLTLHCSGCLP